MSAYDDMLIRQGQPDEAEDEQIQDGAEAVRNIRYLLDNPGELLPEKEAA